MPNTFAIPSAAKSLTLSSVDYNITLQSIWSNFYGPAIPNSGDVTIQNFSSAPLTGSFYRSSIVNALYIYDPSRAKGGALGGYTRQGIATRNYESIAALVANLASVEQGDLLTTVGDSTANYRVYMKTSNSNAIVDIGSPGPGSLTSALFVNRQISNLRLIANTITQYELAPNAVVDSKIADSTISNAKFVLQTITDDRIKNYSILGSSLSNGLVYNNTMHFTGSNIHMSGNVVFTAANKGLRFFDGTRQNTAAVTGFANNGSGASFVSHKSANNNLVFRTASTSLSFTGDSLGTGNFTVTTDSFGNLIWGLTLGTGVAVGVGVGVGVGIGK